MKLDTLDVLLIVGMIIGGCMMYSGISGLNATVNNFINQPQQCGEEKVNVNNEKTEKEH